MEKYPPIRLLKVFPEWEDQLKQLKSWYLENSSSEYCNHQSNMLSFDDWVNLRRIRDEQLQDHLTRCQWYEK